MVLRAGVGVVGLAPKVAVDAQLVDEALHPIDGGLVRVAVRSGAVLAELRLQLGVDLAVERGDLGSRVAGGAPTDTASLDDRNTRTRLLKQQRRGDSAQASAENGDVKAAVRVERRVLVTCCGVEPERLGLRVHRFGLLSQRS